MAFQSPRRDLFPDFSGRPGRFKYQEIADRLEEEIRRHGAPGQKFTPELALSRQFQVNRRTIHKALSLAMQRGLLVQGESGRATIADFREKGFDGRLVAVGIALHTHLWDRLYLALARESVRRQKFMLTCDLSAQSLDREEPLTADMLAERLKEALSLRPRSLILQFPISAEALEKLGPDRWNFRNLVLLQNGPLQHRESTVRIYPDERATWELLARHAIAAGYQRFVILVPDYWKAGLVAPAIQHQLDIHGIDPASLNSYFLRDAQALSGLAQWAQGPGGPLAVIADFDYGAHLALQAFRNLGVSVPDQVGVYGVNNTPWAFQDGLTSVDYDPDLWARHVFAALEELESRGEAADRVIPPVLIPRGSTRPVSGSP